MPCCVNAAWGVTRRRGTADRRELSPAAQRRACFAHAERTARQKGQEQSKEKSETHEQGRSVCCCKDARLLPLCAPLVPSSGRQLLRRTLFLRPLKECARCAGKKGHSDKCGRVGLQQQEPPRHVSDLSLWRIQLSALRRSSFPAHCALCPAVKWGCGRFGDPNAGMPSHSLQVAASSSAHCSLIFCACKHARGSLTLCIFSASLTTARLRTTRQTRGLRDAVVADRTPTVSAPTDVPS
jgi:hypothetical protein